MSENITISKMVSHIHHQCLLKKVDFTLTFDGERKNEIHFSSVGSGTSMSLNISDIHDVDFVGQLKSTLTKLADGTTPS